MQLFGLAIAYGLIWFLWIQLLRVEKQLKYLKNRQEMNSALIKAVGAARGLKTADEIIIEKE